MAGKILDVHPIRPIPQLQKWEQLPALSAKEKARVIERAGKVGYQEESSVVLSPPWTSRIRLNDPSGEGYHRDYLARIDP